MHKIVFDILMCYFVTTSTEHCRRSSVVHLHLTVRASTVKAGLRRFDYSIQGPRTPLKVQLWPRPI